MSAEGLAGQPRATSHGKAPVSYAWRGRAAVMGPRGRGSSREGARTLVYSHPMAIAAPALQPRGFARIFAWRRTRFVLIVSMMFGLILNIGNQAPFFVVMLRALIVGMAILFMFGLFEYRPRQLW